MLIEFANRLLRLLTPASTPRRLHFSAVRGRSSFPAMVELLEPRRMLSGNTITVTSALDDSLPVTPTHLTLRDAITQANSDGGGDTIVFSNVLAGDTIPLTLGSLNITSSMTITGLGAGQLNVSAGSLSNIFDISSSSAVVSISGLTLSNGDATQGGAIVNAGTLTSLNNIFSNDEATGGTTNQGGAIDNSGTLTSTSDTFSNNSAIAGTTNEGGAIYNSGTLTLTSDTFSVNSVTGTSSNYGGAVYNTSQMTSTSDTFSGNSASGGNTNEGGAIYNTSKLSSTSDAISNNTAATTTNGPYSATNAGGGIYSVGSLTITDDTISGNSAAGSNYAASDSGGGIDNQGQMTSSNNVFSGNSSVGLESTNIGGGVYNLATLTSTNDTFSSNSVSGIYGSNYGGGIYNIGVMTTLNDTISGNIAGSGFYNYGAGIYNANLMTSSNDTISGNTALDGYYSSGGGVYNAGALSLTNDTVYGNSASSANYENYGGGIENQQTLTTKYTTITDNSVSGPKNSSNLGGGVDNNGQWNSLNSIIAGDTSGNDVSPSSGTFNAQYTLIGDTSSGLTNGVNGNIVDPTNQTIFVSDVNNVPILANYGGPTQTVELAAGSPAIGAGSSLTTLAVSLDSVTTTFTVNSPTFIATGDFLQIDSEIVQVVSVAGGAVTVLRGQDGTSAANHNVNAPINLYYDQRGFARSANDLGSTAYLVVNPGPVISGVGSTVTYIGLTSPITIAPNISVTDSVNIASATISFTNWQPGDRADFSNIYALQHSFVENDTAHTAMLTITGTATPAQYQTTFQSVVFWAVAGNLNTTATRFATFTVDDVNLTSGSGTQAIAVAAALGTPPVISGLGGTVTYIALTPPITIAQNLVVTDNANINSATVSFTNWQSGDQVQFNNPYSLSDTFVQNTSANTATLTFTGTASAVQYQATLQSVQFWSNLANPVTTNRVATFAVTDVNTYSISASQLIAVSPGQAPPPAVTGVGDTVAYVGQTPPIIIAPNIVVLDGVNIDSATVSFTNWQAGDRVDFDNMYALQHTFVEDLTANTATLTITGTATPAEYSATLQSVEFWAVAGNLNTSTRIATFTVVDDNSNSGSGTQSIEVVPAVSTLNLSGINDTVTYYGGESPITVAPNLALTDSVNIASATVSFTNWEPGDRLTFFNSYALQHTFVEDDVANTATLTITGIASADQYQTTLQSVQYWNVAGVLNIATRVATFTVNDTSSDSVSGLQQINVSYPLTAPPVLSGIDGSVTYTPSTNGTSSILIAPNLGITDSVNVESATVSFTNWQAGDRLTFFNSFALQHTFVEDDIADTASLTITGVATAAQYQTTLQSLVYYCVAGNPNPTTRMATFTVTDVNSNSGSGMQSIVYSNTPPALSGLNGTVVYDAAGTPMTIAPNLGISDSLNITSVTVSFTNWQPGDRIQFYNSFALQHTFVENNAANTATLTITGSAAAAEYATTLQSLQFYSVAGNLNLSNRIATFTVTDANSNTATGSQTIAVIRS